MADIQPAIRQHERRVARRAKGMHFNIELGVTLIIDTLLFTKARWNTDKLFFAIFIHDVMDGAQIIMFLLQMESRV